MDNNVKLDRTERDDVSVTYIYVPYITTRDGRKIFAKAYGHKAFRIPVRDKQ